MKQAKIKCTAIYTYLVPLCIVKMKRPALIFIFFFQSIIFIYF